MGGNIVTRIACQGFGAPEPFRLLIRYGGDSASAYELETNLPRMPFMLNCAPGGHSIRKRSAPTLPKNGYKGEYGNAGRAHLSQLD